MATKAYSLWVYDRHCTLIYHHDWSISPSASSFSPLRPPLAPGPDLLPGVSRCVTTTTATASARDGAASVGQGYPTGTNTSSSSKPPPAAPSSSSQLPLTEHAKLIYGLVYSLRNMLSKLAPTPPANNNGVDAAPPPSSVASPFNTYTASTYSLAHLQTASMYTFVLLTDPVQPPSRGLAGGGGGARGSTAAALRPASALLGGSGSGGGGSDAAGSGSGAGLPTGGGIPGSGGMSLPGVIKQIVGGPWLEWVVRNPATAAATVAPATHDGIKMNGSGGGASVGTGGLEWEEMDDVELEEDGEAQGEGEDLEGEGSRLRGQVRRAERTRGIDSDGFRSAVEAVLAQNKLSTVF